MRWKLVYSIWSPKISLTSLNQIEFAFSIFKPGVLNPPLEGCIPITTMGSDILNFLTKLLQLKIPDNYFLNIVFTKLDPHKLQYRILEENKDLRKYSHVQSLELLAYRPKQFLKIARIVGRIGCRDFDRRMPVSEIVEDLCARPSHRFDGQRRGCFNIRNPMA
jgi:hypothetical protein